MVLCIHDGEDNLSSPSALTEANLPPDLIVCDITTSSVLGVTI